MASTWQRGDSVSLVHYDFNTPNGTMTMQVKSIIEDTKMTGNITVGQFGTFPLNATKAQ